ncbi:MAG: glycoside hydrolase family 31 protein [Burkholderiales bacterium]
MYDFTAFQRLDAPNSLGATASGASFATSTGDVLEVSCFGPGVFRLRLGPNTRPDYGIVVGRVKPCTVTQAGPDRWTFTAGDALLEITAAPLAFRLLWKGAPVLNSITDQHFRGWTRLPAFGRVRATPCWTAAVALESGEAVYGLGEKFGPLDKRGQIIHSQVEDALGVNTGLAYKNTPFAWGPGKGRGAWGLFVNTPSRVTHGVGHPDWSHRSYSVVVEDEALDLFLFAGATPASIVDLYTQLTGRAPAVPRWSLGLWVSRAYYRTPEEAVAVAKKLRERRIPCDVLTLDGRAAWKVETRFNFRWDPDRFRDPKASLAAIRAEHLRVCVWEYPYVSVHDPLFTELAQRHYLLTNDMGEPLVFGWDTAPGTSPFGDVLTPLPESGIVDFTNPAAFAWWRDAHQRLFEDGVDVVKSDFGEQIPPEAVAFNGDRGERLHNVYPLLYNHCVYEATAKFQRRDAGPPMVWSRAGWAGSQRYPIGWGGDPQSDWEGLAASIRGGLSHGMSGNPYHSSDIGGFYGAAQPDAELYLRWLQMSVFASHIRVHGIGEREPWAFGPEAEAVARKWLAFRYRLIPYLERVIVQATRTGLPVMRAMALAFPGNALVAGFETQFLCGEALLVAPIVQPGGEVEIALPPGAWYDINTRTRHAGRQVLRYRAGLDQFPVFGREGYALPLGRAVQHTGEIDAANPLEHLWLFGAPAHSLDGFTQARIEADGEGGFTLRTSETLDVVRFG